MDVVLKYRGRVIRESDLGVIRALVEQHPTASRRRLSQQLCAIWNWVQPNGAVCDMICRGLMLTLERAGHIALPPTRSKPVNPLVSRPRPRLIETDTTPIECGLKDLGPLQFRLVRRTPEEPLFNSLIEHHHYLRYTHGVGEQLKYMVFAGERPVACLAWSSAARHLGPRDRFIGWTREARRRNIRFLAYNSRYLLLPWVRVKFLASHILGRMASDRYCASMSRSQLTTPARSRPARRYAQTFPISAAESRMLPANGYSSAATEHGRSTGGSMIPTVSTHA